MFESVHDMAVRGLKDFPTKLRHEWVLQWPGMTVLAVSAIYWTQGVCLCVLCVRRCVCVYVLVIAEVCV